MDDRDPPPSRGSVPGSAPAAAPASAHTSTDGSVTRTSGGSGPPAPNDATLEREDWDTYRALAHRMVDDAVDWLATVRERPAWQPVPPEVASSFREPLPREGTDAEAVYDDFVERILPYPMGNVHPRFWAWYMGSGSFMAALGAFWAAVFNSNLGGGEHVAVKVEKQVVDWCVELVGLPAASSGLLTSGASVANLVGLAVARNAHAVGDVRRDGVAGEQLVGYGSTETHSCNPRAFELMGLGRAALRNVPVDAAYRIDREALAAAVAADREAGLRPFCVIANAGTINTGAIDDMDALADFCAAEGLWLHVDGAIGAVAAASPSLAPLLAGMERADSVALDLHKWLHVPFEAGVALVRDPVAHRGTFAYESAAYLEHATTGLASGDTWFHEYGLQLTRDFKALKVWMAFKEQGMDLLGRLIERNVDQAEAFAERVRREPDLELGAPVGLDIVCFRYAPRDRNLSPGQLDRLNRRLLESMHESGVAVPSYTTLDGRFWLRIAISNHRSTDADFDVFAAALLEQGAQLLGEVDAADA